MAQQGVGQNPNIQQLSPDHTIPHPQRSPDDSERFPIFENYLKMARFNLTEVEVLNRCLITNEPDISSTAPSSAENDAVNLNDLMELDQESLLDMLEGDSDFSDTVSDFSSISISQLKRKKKRSERWRRGKPTSTEQPVRPSSELLDHSIGRRRISPHGSINHKTIVIQHDNKRRTSSEENGELERPRSRHSSRGSNSSTPRHGEQHLDHNTNAGAATINHPRPQSRNSHKSWSSKIEPTSASGGSGSDNSSTECSLAPSQAETTQKQYNKAEHTRHKKRVKHSNTNGGVDMSIRHRKSRRRQRKIEGEESDRTVSTNSSEYDERNLGRNMRAVARTSLRKLRT